MLEIQLTLRGVHPRASLNIHSIKLTICSMPSPILGPLNTPTLMDLTAFLGGLWILFKHLIFVHFPFFLFFGIEIFHPTSEGYCYIHFSVYNLMIKIKFCKRKRCIDYQKDPLWHCLLFPATKEQSLTRCWEDSIRKGTGRPRSALRGAEAPLLADDRGRVGFLVKADQASDGT